MWLQNVKKWFDTDCKIYFNYWLVWLQSSDRNVVVKVVKALEMNPSMFSPLPILRIERDIGRVINLPVMMA